MRPSQAGPPRAGGRPHVPRMRTQPEMWHAIARAAAHDALASTPRSGRSEASFHSDERSASNCVVFSQASIWLAKEFLTTRF